MSKAQLYVRGMKDPIELENNEAKAAEALIADVSKTPDTAFYIEGVWSGRKADMKFVTWPKREDSWQGKEEVADMTPIEVVAFEKEIIQDKEASKKEFGKDIHWDLYFLRRNGCIILRIVKSPLGFLVPNYGVLDAEKFFDYQDKISSYSAFKAKKEFVEKKKIEGLEEMAKQMNI